MHSVRQMTEAHQNADLACAESKALNPAYMQADGMDGMDGMDDMGDYYEEVLAQQAICIQHAQMQAGMGGRQR